MRFMPHNGYAPGNYFINCMKCGANGMPAGADKRATYCITCAFGGTDPVFVFGSNLRGRHGKGAALFAANHRGAIEGQSEGLMGNSYGIPTKNRSNPLGTLPLPYIRTGVATFLAFAAQRNDLMFQVTPLGCGLACHEAKDVAPMFAAAPDNCILPIEFKQVLQP